jgi:hypothetical protein
MLLAHDEATPLHMDVRAGQRLCGWWTRGLGSNGTVPCLVQSCLSLNCAPRERLKNTMICDHPNTRRRKARILWCFKLCQDRREGFLHRLCHATLGRNFRRQLRVIYRLDRVDRQLLPCFPTLIDSEPD